MTSSMEVDGEGATLQALEAIPGVMTELAETPLSYSLHYKLFKLFEVAGIETELQGPRSNLTNVLAATEDVWIPLLEGKMTEAEASTELSLEAEELFNQAERDYLSIPILKLHLEFLFKQAARLADSPMDLPEGFAEAYSPDAGHEVWNTYIEWEQGRLEMMTGPERSKTATALQQLYLARLATPHLNHAQTYEAFSSFVSNFLPNDVYEDTLVAATETRKNAVKIATEREQYETSLPSMQAYSAYLAWESGPKKPKNYPKRGRNQQKPQDIPPDPKLVAGLYERAIAEAAAQRAEGLRSGDDTNGVRVTAEAWLTSFWDGLSAFLRENAKDRDRELAVIERATRSVPGDGSLIASRIRVLEYFGENDDETIQAVSDVFDSAMLNTLLDARAVTAVTIARAGVELRKLREDGEDAEAYSRLTTVLQTGIEKCCEKGGDETLKLEKMFTTALIEFATARDEALQVWESTAKFYKTKYFAWTEYAAFLVNPLGEYEKARKVYKDAATPSRNLDYPQALWNAWIAFEEMYGSIDQLEHAMKRVRKMTADLATKAAQAAEQAAQHQAEAAALIYEATAPAVAQPDTAAMIVDDPPPTASTSQKRKAEDEPAVEQATKKPKPDTDAPLKRDRENSTVFVAGLWEGLQDQDLKNLFKDCGSIREIKITKLANDVVATVEFMERDHVLPALTKDKKKIQGNEVAVFLAWQSTLYITNFPENVDDAFVRDLFGKYGVIFDVRWPSKKYKATRRFCYVQYISPEAAQQALELNGKELKEGMPMNVYISNPTRKKERTDAGIEQREVYIAGLAKNTTQKELEELFVPCGEIKGLRLPLDDRGKAKGFAFVEFTHETSALAALALNNKELKKRRIAVTMVDPRAPSRKDQPTNGLSKQADIVSRSVRIKKLPEGSDEGLLQQAIEKIATGVKKVEIFQESWEAAVEFETAADAGKLLLAADGLTFQGVQLELVDEAQVKAPKGTSIKTSAAPVASSSFVPRAAAKPKTRVGLGFKKPAPKFQPSTKGAEAGPSSSTAPVTGPSASERKGGKDQDAFRAMLAGKK